MGASIATSLGFKNVDLFGKAFDRASTVLEAELGRRESGEGIRTGLSHLSEASEMTTGDVSNGAHISRARRYQLRHKQAGLCMVCSLPAVSKQYCAKHAVAAREQQRARLKHKRRNLGAASYSFFEDEQLIAKATTTVLGWLDVRPTLPASGDQSAPIPIPPATPAPTKPPSVIGSVREFAVPLPSGAIAAFKIPFPMSEEDFYQYSKLLTAYKTGIVKKREE
jgi:hypothetical protein